MESDSHSFPIDIQPSDIDFMGHVNNAVYLKWTQDVVLKHWQRIAPPDAVEGYLWVALKHEITYRRPAFLEDTLTANLTFERVQGASAFFETLIKRGEQVLAEIKSRWCCLDSDTLEPVRPSAQLIERFA